MRLAHPQPALVIGYGNELRGDDAAGPQVIQELLRLNLEGVKAVAVQQLTPECAHEISSARLVIFVDAAASPTPNQVVVHPLRPSNHASHIGHVSNPEELLALALALFHECPPAWLVTLPSRSFELGAGVSVVTAQAIPRAVAQIQELLATKR